MNGFAKDALALVRAVGFGAIEERNAVIEGGAKQRGLLGREAGVAIREDLRPRFRDTIADDLIEIF